MILNKYTYNRNFAYHIHNTNVLTESKKSSSSSFSGWLVIISMILISGFIYWYKCKNGDSKCKSILGQTNDVDVNTSQAQPLLNNRKDTYVY